MLTDEKVQQMMIEFKPKQDFNGSWNSLSVSDVYKNEEIKIGYTYGGIKTSQNMVKTSCIDIYRNWYFYIPQGFCKTSSFIKNT